MATGFYAYGVLWMSDRFKRWEATKTAAYHRYRFEWCDRVTAGDAGDYPLNLDFEVTTRCNLACTFCTQPSLRKDELGDMTHELVDTVVEECGGYVPAANFNGLGEPLLNRNTLSFVRFAKLSGFLDVMFHTNGSMMTNGLAERICTSGVDRVIFSVDAPDKQTYEAMRVGAKYERLERNVALLSQFHNDNYPYASAPMIRTTMIVTDKTVDQVPAFLEKWKPYADQITLQDLTWRAKGEIWTSGERSAIPQSLDEVRDIAVEKKIGFRCPYLFQTAYVYWNADVIPCSNPNARYQMVMGKIEGSETVKSIWNGEKYRELRQLHLSGRWYEHPVCRNCEVPLIELAKVLYPSPTSAEELAR